MKNNRWMLERRERFWPLKMTLAFRVKPTELPAKIKTHVLQKKALASRFHIIGATLRFTGNL